MVMTSKDTETLLESTRAFVYLAFDESSFGSVELLMQYENLIPVFLELVMHPELTIKIQAIQAIAYCMSEHKLEEIRHTVVTETSLILDITKLLSID